MECFVCHKPIVDPEKAHPQHRRGCQVRDTGVCTCEDAVYTHPECCPDCMKLLKVALKRYILSRLSKGQIEKLQRAQRRASGKWN
jgi:hypothetical protein